MIHLCEVGTDVYKFKSKSGMKLMLRRYYNNGTARKAECLSSKSGKKKTQLVWEDD